MFSKEQRVTNKEKKSKISHSNVLLSNLEGFKISLSDKHGPECGEFELNEICSATANMRLSDDLFDDVVFKTIKDLQDERRDYYFDNDVERFRIQLNQSQGSNLEAQSSDIDTEITELSTLLAANITKIDEVDAICTGINHNSFFNTKSETSPVQYAADAKWMKADGQAMNFAERNAARRAAKKGLNTEIVTDRNVTSEQNTNPGEGGDSFGYVL